MSISHIDKTDIEFSSQVTFVDRWAKNIFIKLFKQLSRGKLILRDGEETFAFGQTNQTAELTGHVSVKHHSFYREIILGGSIGAGESYMSGSWNSPDLVKVVRVIVNNMVLLERMDSRSSLGRQFMLKAMKLLTRNNLLGSRRNISAHYDLGNDFFSLFLDKSMMYSAAIFATPSTSLEQASVTKLHHICNRLQLKPTDHLLEIGTGWGGLAIYAAKHFGCRVTTTTLSKEQYDYAKQWIEKEGLTDRITLLLQDYRHLTGHFDKLVSIEMIEAVGYQYYKQYFRQCSSLIKPNGLMLIQAITIPDQRYHSAKNSVDFIQRYIFPGGCLPCNNIICSQVAEHTDMQIIGLEDITADYAYTIAAWRAGFLAQLAKVRHQGFNETFIRMWDFYLAYCEGGFRERVIHTAQYLIAKPEFRATPAIKV